MDYEKATGELRRYKEGTVVNLTWDGRNGEINRDYVFLGFDEKGIPVLKAYNDGWTIHQYVEEKVQFDILNPEIKLVDMHRDAHKSAALLEEIASLMDNA